MKRVHLSATFTSTLLGMIACNGAPSDVPDKDVPLVPATTVHLALSAHVQEEKEALDAALETVAALDADAFAREAQVEFESLPYDPGEAEGLSLIENSAIGLSDVEREKLRENGFVISSRNSFPTFAYGYAAIYGDHLPLFVSADSILYALHTSYDAILKAFEEQSLLPELAYYLNGMRDALLRADLSEVNRADLDVFLTVAESLLTGEGEKPADGSNASKVRELYEGCRKAEGAAGVQIFGVNRRIDFSQCTPRGHYTDSEGLSRYFQAMMWLGRIDFRLIETQEDGSSLFHRRQLEGALALRSLMNDALSASHKGVDDFVTAFVGEHDYMTVPQLGELMRDLEITKLSELSGLSDATITQAIVDGGYGTQRIASHYMVSGTGSGTLPLSSSFALFGQRYVLDSHVFSNVVFDRAQKGALRRMMPNPLDVAYAALKNDQAGMLLADEMEIYDYAADLQSMRVLADHEPAEFWEKNLYNGWLSALRTLSPASTLNEADATTLPSIARSEAWGRRLLNTQLASWAELRHDTILYVKQSYTTGISCEFPDAYVEPYPEFFKRIQAYADHALGLIESVSFAAPPQTREHFEHFSEVAGVLGEMAEHQRSGAAHTDAHMAFINEAVTIDVVCGDATADGWYPRLFYGSSVDWQPTIADVHTQPMDESGNDVGRILHVGTGDARLMVTTIETCSGPRAYAGLVSSYYERIEEGWERLTDPEWEGILLQDEQPPTPTWFRSLETR
jgi:hypothetical protein